MLEPHDELGLERAARLQKQNAAEEIEQFGVEIGAIGFGGVDSLVDIELVLRTDFTGFGADVGAVDAEASDDFANHRIQIAASVIAVA